MIGLLLFRFVSLIVSSIPRQSPTPFAFLLRSREVISLESLVQYTLWQVVKYKRDTGVYSTIMDDDSPPHWEFTCGSWQLRCQKDTVYCPQNRRRNGTRRRLLVISHESPDPQVNCRIKGNPMDHQTHSPGWRWRCQWCSFSTGTNPSPLNAIPVLEGPTSPRIVTRKQHNKTYVDTVRCTVNTFIINTP